MKTVTKGEVAPNEQFLLLPQSVLLYSIHIFIFTEIVNSFEQMLSKKWSAVDLMYLRKGKCVKFSKGPNPMKFVKLAHS